MKAILIDDEQANLENLEILLGKHCAQVSVVGKAANVSDALQLIQLNNPDLLLLDIQMGKETGFDLLQQIDSKSLEVIFVTAYDHYGIQAVKYAALDYLLKPVNIDELKEAVAKAKTRVDSRNQNEQLQFLLQNLRQPQMQATRIALPQQSEVRYVQIDDIIRCEASNTYTFFILSSGERVLISKPLKDYADLLKPKGFLRTHQTHLVNPKFIKSWLKEDGGVLLLVNQEKIPISKMNRETIKQALTF